jgi:hypothetical protein
MTIAAEMVLHSISPNRIPIRTMRLRYPKFIHAELMTHRVFSRNASSSRAIPVERLIQDVRDDTAMPLKWFSNKPGMQGGEEIVGADRDDLVAEWIEARDFAIQSAMRMLKIGAHKQHINRVIEPFSHINVVVTSTSWANWNALRDHKDAQPEIRELANQINIAAKASRPTLLQPGQWHLPFVTEQDWLMIGGEEGVIDREALKVLIKLSVARCARVSYLTQDGETPKLDADLALYEKLVGSEPLHASPAEHQATPDKLNLYDGKYWDWGQAGLHGNFKGWVQFRKTLKGEYVADKPFMRQIEEESAA